MSRQALAALVLGTLLAVPAAATGAWDHADRWGAGGWQNGRVYPSAADWWGRPAPALSAFMAPLAGYGRWVAHPGLGRVWLPRVGHGWQPYRFGHWIRHPRWGWTWQADEPFGWVVFHYGRWGFDPRLGWFWVPGTAFAPHWADVRWSARWHAWAPLPPPGWAGGGSWTWGPRGWDFGYPGWVHAPRGAALRPGWQPSPRPPRAAFERMTPNAPLPVAATPPAALLPDRAPAWPGAAPAREPARLQDGREGWARPVPPARVTNGWPEAGGIADTEAPIRPGLATPQPLPAPAPSAAPPVAAPAPGWAARPPAARTPEMYRPSPGLRGGFEEGAAANEP